MGAEVDRQHDICQQLLIRVAALEQLVETLVRHDPYSSHVYTRNWQEL